MEKIILLCQDFIGVKMAGPAIRYWEMAHALAHKYEVILYSVLKPEKTSPHIQVEHYSTASLRKALKNAKGLIAQQIPLSAAFFAKKERVPLILDLYAPEPIEHLELFRFDALDKQQEHLHQCLKKLQFSLKLADYVLAANVRQRDLWLGFLFSQSKIAIADYSKSPHLETKIGIVPFGLSSTPPNKTGPGIREKLQLKPTAEVLIWGGGVWNWFDPLTLIKAVNQLHKKGRDIHLVFMGLKHPNDGIPAMKMSYQALELAKELNLLDKAVHFNYGWIPYEERQNFLLDADIGVSTHFDHLETHFSFRTRLLDYLWTGLPIVATKGDCFEEVIQKHQIGISVPSENPQALSQALETLLDAKEARAEMKKNIARFSQQFTWEQVIAPLEAFLEQKKKPISTKKSLLSQWEILHTFVRSKGIKKLSLYVFQKLLPKKVWS